MFSAHGGSSFVRLAPEGFELNRGASTVRGEWADLTAITDRRPGKSAPIRATLFLRFSSGRKRTLVVDPYTPRGEAIGRFIRYYWINAGRRDELSDRRGIERFAKVEAES